uniref:Suppressor of tub2 mutation n=1 Tax=Panagrellus redivivus TaxID=6233 RepID=A0A7E4UV55_PANRE
MSLNQIARDHRFISYRQLETEAVHSFKSLMEQLGSDGTSLLHLISALTAAMHVCRARPEFISQVVQACETLSSNLPPTLGTGQIKSVQKEMKNHLLRLLKLYTVFEKHTPQVRSLLKDLGASDNEIRRNLPEPQQVNAWLKHRVETTAAAKRAHDGVSGVLAKKMRIDDNDYDDQRASTVFDDQEEANKANQEAVDLTTNWIMERMNGVVTRLVFLNLVSMPSEKPSGYDANRFPVPREVTPEVQRDVARRMAIQFMREGKGPGVEYVAEVKRKLFFAKQKAKQEGLAIPPTPADLRHAGPGSAPKAPKVDKDGFAMPMAPVRVNKAVLKQDLFRETQPLKAAEQRELRIHIFKRLLDSEASMSHPKMRISLYKSLVYAVARVHNAQTPEMEDLLLNFAISDQKKRGELLKMWIDELYAQCNGVSTCIADSEDSVVLSENENNNRYDTLLVDCLTKLFTLKAHKETLFHSLILDAPIVTPGALLILRKACLDQDCCPYATGTLRELIIKKTTQRHEFLKVLLELSYVENDTVRHESIATTKELFALESVHDEVLDFVYQMCDRVQESIVPPVIWSSCVDAVDNSQAEETRWTEQYALSGLILPMSMVSLDTRLIEKLTEVFAHCGNIIVKRVILNSIEKHSKQLEQSDENFLRAIDTCPSGGEALIAKLVTNVTNHADPSPEVVRRLKNLQERYNSDIRSLAPIIPGLTKEECLELVPKFVLNATANRSVPTFYKKILRANNLVTHQPSVTVVELMEKLHTLENVSKKQATLLQSNIDVLIVDPKNEFYDESNQIVAAVEKLANLPNANQFVFHSIQRLFEKHKALGVTLSKTLLSCAEKKPWNRCPEAWETFKECAVAMDIFAYAALLFATTWTQFQEVIDKKRDPKLGQKLKSYISTLPAHQQLLIDKRVIDLIKSELAAETEKKDRRKGGDVLLDSGWAEAHHLSNAFFNAGRKDNVEELPWLKHGVEEQIKVRSDDEAGLNDDEMGEGSDHHADGDVLMEEPAATVTHDESVDENIKPANVSAEAADLDGSSEVVETPMEL